MTVFKLIEYETTDGTSPFSKWLYAKEIDETLRARIFQRLDRLSVGNPGDHKAVGKGVLELRFKFGSGFRMKLPGASSRASDIMPQAPLIFSLPQAAGY